MLPERGTPPHDETSGRSKMNILHAVRVSTNDRLRRVLTLMEGQVARGHRVGLVAEASGFEDAVEILQKFETKLLLGLNWVPVGRYGVLRDVATWRSVLSRVRKLDLDVVHGHGTKGGAYARLIRGRRAVRAYTPYRGGGRLDGAISAQLERLLLRRTELFLFQSAWLRDAFRSTVGKGVSIERIVHEGVADSDFRPIELAPDATDLIFSGALRRTAGVHILIEAIRLLAADGRPVPVTMAGEGPERTALRTQASRCGLGHLVRFIGGMSARQACAHGRVLIAPSLSEPFPEGLLEAAAAGMPIVTTNVGGISEIFGSERGRLIPPGDAPGLARAIAASLSDLPAAAAAARIVQAQVRARFTADAMVEQVLKGYADALAMRRWRLRQVNSPPLMLDSGRSDSRPDWISALMREHNKPREAV